MRIRNLLFGEVTEALVGNQHGVNRIADDHARCTFIRELRVEREAEFGEKFDGFFEIFHREIDIDLGGHTGGRKEISVYSRIVYMTIIRNRDLRGKDDMRILNILV